MNLFMMRHGIAVERGAPGVKTDRDRQLTAKGVKHVRQEAEGLLALRLSFDRILTSPFPRSSETARIVAEILGIKNNRLAKLAALAPGGTVTELMRSIRPYSKNTRLLLVGHEPLLSETISYLLNGTEEMELRLKKGGICRIEVEGLPSKGAVLHWLLTPKQLRLLARQ
ncbi:MAG: phosphohistidine phosphatase SixA [Deltaproteobacteria bacterium]|nr:phosphohistidine phosphatase SixA [Deltaproteobacteria bacterium]